MGGEVCCYSSLMVVEEIGEVRRLMWFDLFRFMLSMEDSMGGEIF